MNDEVGQLLVEQLSHEMYNHNLYLTFASFYKEEGLHKLSEYFKERAEEELVHGRWISDRLNQCDYPYKYPEIKTVDVTIESKIDPFIQTVEAEIETTFLITKIGDKALEDGDYTTLMWLYELLLREQHEEEYVSRQSLKLAMDDTDWQTKQDSIIEFYEEYNQLKIS